MFSTDFIFRQQENLVDNQICQAGFRPLCNKIPNQVLVDERHITNGGMGNYTRMKIQKKGENKMTKAKTIFFFTNYKTPKTKLNQYMETQNNSL